MENENGMVMPVGPMYGSGFGGNNGFDGGGWWILLLFILLGYGGRGFGGNGGNDIYPWMNQSNQMNDGFQNQMLNTQVEGVRSGLGDINLGIAGLGSNITGAVRDGFYGAEIAANQRQMSSMQQDFAMQNAFQNCCCENRLATAQTQEIIRTEAAATRLAIQNQTQEILDKLCQQEIDALKAQNLALQNQVNMQNLAASQTAQTARLIADNTMQTQYIVNRVAPYPVPSYTVANPNTPATAA